MCDQHCLANRVVFWKQRPPHCSAEHQHRKKPQKSSWFLWLLANIKLRFLSSTSIASSCHTNQTLQWKVSLGPTQLTEEQIKSMQRDSRYSHMQIGVWEIKGFWGHMKSNGQRQAGMRKWFKSNSPTQKPRRAEPAQGAKLQHILQAHREHFQIEEQWPSHNYLASIS